MGILEERLPEGGGGAGTSWGQIPAPPWVSCSWTERRISEHHFSSEGAAG